jgi:hypothetical protein
MTTATNTTPVQALRAALKPAVFNGRKVTVRLTASRGSYDTVG